MAVKNTLGMFEAVGLNPTTVSKADSVAKAAQSKQAKFSSQELSQSFDQFKALYPNSSFEERQNFLVQQNAFQQSQNNSFLEDVGTDLGIAFGDRLPQTGGALLGLAGDAIGSDTLSRVGWDYAKQQQQEMQASQETYSPDLASAKANILARAEARKAEAMSDGDMSAMDSLNEFFGTVGDYIVNPRAAASEAVQSSESLLTMVASGGVAGAVAKGAVKSAAKKKLGDTLKKKYVQEAIEAKANQAALTASSSVGTAYTGASEGANNALQTRDALNEIPEETLRESPDFQEYLKENDGDFDKAKDEFVKSGTADTFLISGSVAALVGKASGASDTFAQSLVKQGKKSVVKDAVKAGVTETVEETIQSGAGQLIGNIQVKKGDASQDILEDVGTNAGAGAVAGGLSGAVTSGAVGGLQKAGETITKGAEKVVQQKAIKEQQAKAKEEDETVAEYDKAKESPESVFEEFENASDEDLVKNMPKVVTSLVALREKQNSGDLTPEESAELGTKIDALKARAQKANAEAIKKTAETTAKVVAEPEKANSADTQGAFVNTVATGNADNAQVLKGSKHLTTNQKKLLDAISKPESPIGKRLKSAEEVHDEVVGGGEGFTGLIEYVDALSTVVTEKDPQRASRLLRQLTGFGASQQKKIQTGKFADGNKIPDATMALIKDEANAIKLVQDAYTDTLEKSLPEFKDFQQSATSKVKQKLNIDTNTAPDVESQVTLPRKQRKAIVQEVRATLFNLKESPEGMEQVRFKLRKAGVTKSKIDAVEEAFKTVEAIEGKKNLTPEVRKELNDANTLIDDTFVELTSALGADGLRETLDKFGVKENVESAYSVKENELDASKVEATEGHIPEQPSQKELSSEAQFKKYNELVQSIKDYVSQTPDALDDADINAQYNTVVDTELNAFSEGTQGTYNNAVELFNTLGVTNAQVTTANSETKAVTTTPSNRTYQNVIERSPFLSKSFRFVKRQIGLLHTENSLVQKLSNEKTDIYTHLTRNLSQTDKDDLNAFATYLGKFENHLNHTLKAREKAKAEGEKFNREYINDYLDEFIVDGKFIPSVASAIATGFADWMATSAHKTFRNDDRGVAKLIGENPESYNVVGADENLREAGIARTYVIEQVGRHIMATMGLTPKGTANENITKQMASNLGIAALSSAMEKSGPILEQHYAHRMVDAKGNTVFSFVSDSSNPDEAKKAAKEKGIVGEFNTAIPTVKMKLNKTQPEDGTRRLTTLADNGIRGARNVSLIRDFFGAESAIVPPVFDGQEMKDHTEDPNMSSTQAEAMNKNQNLEYELDNAGWDLFSQFDEEAQLALVDTVTPDEEAHVNNRDRNTSIRENIKREVDGLKELVRQMNEAGSKYVRFPMQASKRNKRMTMLGTLGNVQNSKLVRHLFKLKGAEVEIDNPALRTAYMKAVMEALDEDSTQGKGVDKSSDVAVTQAFNELVKSGKYAKAVEAIKSGKLEGEGKEAVQGFASSMHKLEGLIALSKYDADKAFTVNLVKENDGITNGIAIALLQYAGADSFDDYRERLARVGVFVNGNFDTFGQFSNTDGNKDSYVDFGDAVTNRLKKPEDYPASEDNILPELNFFTTITNLNQKGLVKGLGGAKVEVVTADFEVKQEPVINGYKNKQGKYVTKGLRIPRELHTQAAKGLQFFLGKGFIKNGEFVTLNDEILALIRDFSKDPLMIANYGSSIKSIKTSIASKITGAVTTALEEANRLEGKAREVALKDIESAVNLTNIFGVESFVEGELKPWEFKLADDVLETTVDDTTWDVIAAAVDVTYGAAVDGAFTEKYGNQRDTVDVVIQATRIATDIYAQQLETARQAKMKELGKDWLSVDEAKEVKESLSAKSPMVRHALGDDRLKDGIWVAKGEKSKDTTKNKSDQVKLAMPMGETGSVETATYSDKVKDPGVSAGAIMVQSLDASIQALLMRIAEMVNIHDASIFKLDQMNGNTEEYNRIFMELMSDYSIMDAVLEMLKASLEGATPEMQANTVKMLNEKNSLEKHLGENATLEQFVKYMEGVAKQSNGRVKIITDHTNTVTTQYNNGDVGQYTRENTDLYTEAELAKEFANPTDEFVLVPPVAPAPVPSTNDEVITPVDPNQLSLFGSTSNKLTREEASAIQAEIAPKLNGSKELGQEWLKLKNTTFDSAEAKDEALDAFMKKLGVTESTPKPEVKDDWATTLDNSPSEGEKGFFLSIGEKLKKHYGSTEEGTVIDMVMKKLEHNPPKFRNYMFEGDIPAELKETAKNFRGMYDPETHTVHIFVNASNNPSDEMYYDTLFHELDHAANVYALEQDALSGNPSREYRQLEDLWLNLKNNRKTTIIQAIGQDNYDYIFGTEHSTHRNIGEMLAFAKGDKNFKALLSQTNIKMPRGDASARNAWEHMLRLALRILNKTMDFDMLNAYQAMIGLSAKYYGIDHANVQTQETHLVSTLGKNKDGSNSKRRSEAFHKTRDALLYRMNKGMSYAEAKEAMTNPKYAKEQKQVFTAYEKRSREINADDQYGAPISTETAQFIKDMELNRGTLGHIFTALAGKGPVQASKEHMKRLERMVTLIQPTIDKLTLSLYKDNQEASGELTESGINLTINTGAKANNIEMSTGEVLVHELSHTLFQGMDKKSPEYKEIVREYKKARKELKPEDFLTGIVNPTDVDKKAALDRYNHTIHNRVEGGKGYTTYLGLDGQVRNADPVEEFAVMAMTNEPLILALQARDKRLSQDGETQSMIERIRSLFQHLLNVMESKVDTRGLGTDAKMVRLVEHLQGSMNNKKSLVYRGIQKADSVLHTADEWVKDKVNPFRQVPKEIMGKISEDMGIPEMRAKLKSAIEAQSFAQNKTVIGIYNEFTTGRASLANLARLISKNSHTIEQESQFYTETITKELQAVYEGITEQESADIYSLLETDAQSLLGTHSIAEVLELVTKQDVRDARIKALKAELKKVAPSAFRYMSVHAEDLGYHLTTGERLIADGKYTNAYQIANMWGYDGKAGTIDAQQAQVIVDELATLHSLNYADLDVTNASLFDDSKFGTRGLEVALAYHQEIMEAGLETTFKDNEYNMRKGYLKEEYENNVDITIGTKADHVRLTNLGYTQGEPVRGDDLTSNRGEFYYIKENGEMAAYVTGALSTASPSRRGTDLFKISPSDSELQRLRVVLQEQELNKGKKALAKQAFSGYAPYLKAEKRSQVAQPIFDARGSVTGYRYVSTNTAKDTVHGRKKDFTRALGRTFSNISRQNNTVALNQELMETFHQTYVDSYHKEPDLFIDISTDPEYKDQYNLIPEAAKRHAKTLYGSSAIYVRRTEATVALGYRKFSVAQLQYDRDPKATAYRESLRHLNNLATVMFNNQVGISVENYWQAFVSTGKDTLVIKSGMVTAANIGSNLALLWMCGVNPVQATKDHAEAYTSTWKWLKDKEREFAIGLELNRPELTKQQKIELEGERAMLRQEMYNNPVREMMEAGLYSAIVDDVEVGEHVAPTKDLIEQKFEPVLNKTPEAVKTVAKNFMLTHDTKAYKVMRDIAQISDFAAKYSLHKHNVKNGMKFQDSINDVRTTFVDYDIPQMKSLQYANDMGLLGFTKYMFRTQQVLIKRLGERPSRVLGFLMLNNFLGLGIPTPYDAIFSLDALGNRVYTPADWASFHTQSAPINLTVG
ncbi:virion RNA polymerase [Vibrio phage 1.245.O._10N.261.54.C7]|uniref:Coil containing protein n=1 Tax=Vibrio phage 1.245.O._10N.261.54.C7 TaxID=1881236 RepID=A0A2I7RWD0_9CAUD|nr:virion RNA polymerase [Vibrio phage 1.245.O._10N.261.54.C7]AUR97957.1 coil containing protein [Vibrio phage 1.245.O._10N.261.54.C7]